MYKQQIRKDFMAMRAALSAEEYQRLNQQLLIRFQQIDFTGIRCIHFFLPITARNEPDTSAMRNWLKVQHPEIKIAYPKTDFNSCTIINYADDRQLELAVNGRGITEPVKGNIVAADEIDLVMVPLLAFDRQGYRVGYGKGFYDRFLVQCRSDAVFTGISFFDPVPLIDDIDKYDVRLHSCLLPGQIWRRV